MSRRSYQKQSRGRKQREARRPNGEVQLPLCREELVELMQDSLARFATEMGLRVAARLLEDEVDRRCGPRDTVVIAGPQAIYGCTVLLVKAICPRKIYQRAKF